MNRSRIALAVLVAGVGAAVRRRLQTRNDAGGSTTESASPNTASKEAAVDRAVAPQVSSPQGSAAQVSESTAAESRAESVADRAPTDAPATNVVSEPAPLGTDDRPPKTSASDHASAPTDAVIEPVREPSLADTVDEAPAADGLVEPAAEPVPAEAADEPVPAEAVDPAPLTIVLPSMPSAGTNKVVQPLDVPAAPNDDSAADQAGVINHDN